MDKRFEELARLVGRALAKRWMQQLTERKVHPRGRDGDGDARTAIPIPARSPTTREPHHRIPLRQTQRDTCDVDEFVTPYAPSRQGNTNVATY